MQNFKLFYEASRFLRKKIICKKPFYIRRTNLKDLDGECSFKKDYFLIKINKELSECHSIDVMLHEVAHAHAWGKEKDVHGPAWGISYSHVYRTFEDFLHR